MKKIIDPGVFVETDTIQLVQWMVQPGDDEGKFSAWVRVERSPGLSEVHIKVRGDYTTKEEAETAARQRSEEVIQKILGDQEESTNRLPEKLGPDAANEVAEEHQNSQ